MRTCWRRFASNAHNNKTVLQLIERGVPWRYSLTSRNQIFVELLQGKEDNKLQPRISPKG